MIFKQARHEESTLKYNKDKEDTKENQRRERKESTSELTCNLEVLKHRSDDLSYRQSITSPTSNFSSFIYSHSTMGSVKYTPPPTPSPSASCYAMSDDDEDEYHTIAQAASRRGVKLLFSKSKVRELPSSKVASVNFPTDKKSRSTFIQLHPPKTTSLASLP